jgi:hypothetical protein
MHTDRMNPQRMVVTGTVGSGALNVVMPVKLVGAKPLFLPAIGWEGLNSPEIGWPGAALPDRRAVGVLWAKPGSAARVSTPTAARAVPALSAEERGKALQAGRSATMARFHNIYKNPSPGPAS